MPFFAASGNCHYRESVAVDIAAEARFPLVLSPFRVLHLECVGDCYQPLPLLSFAPLPCGSGRDFSGLSHCSPCVQTHKCVRTFTLLGVAALQGVPPFLSCSVLPPNPPLRFDGWWALLSVTVGIYTFRLAPEILWTCVRGIGHLAMNQCRRPSWALRPGL